MNEREVLGALAGVRDPEIPTCSIVDLGMVERVTVSGGAVEVVLLPTFLGCPAREPILRLAEQAVRAVAGGRDVRVTYATAPPWTTDRVTPRGREALRAHGISPGPIAGGTASCPFCGSQDTVQESAFGPTPCRSTHFCRSCRNPFEAFKPKRARGPQLPLAPAPPHEEVPP